MEFESPLSQFRVLKKTVKYFELKVRNSQIVEQPLSRRDDPEVSVDVRTPFGKIFWVKVTSRRTKVKTTSKVTVRGRPGTWHMFLSAIVLLMSGPFFYMAIDSGNILTYVFAGFCVVLGIASIIMPFIRLARISKILKEVLSSEDNDLFEEEDKSTSIAVTSRVSME